MSAPFLWGNWGGSGEMGLWIFLSLKRIFDCKYFPKSVNFTFSLPFYTVKTVMKRSFAWKYDGSARQQLKIQPCRVSTLAVQLDTPHSILRNGVNGSFAPIGWPRKGGRNSDSTTQAKESSVCFLSGEQMPATGVISVATQMKGPQTR